VRSQLERVRDKTGARRRTELARYAMEQGIVADHVTVYRRVQRFTPLFVDAARPCRHSPGDRWFVDETYVKVGGRSCYLYRAVDQFGQVIDVYLSARRDARVAGAFFDSAIAVTQIEPVEVVTDRAHAYRYTVTWSTTIPRSASSSSISR
jgi:transposase, IS6 family